MIGRAKFFENGCVLRVQILEDKSDDKLEKYRLKVFGVIYLSNRSNLRAIFLQHGSDVKEGSEFTCVKDKKSKQWQLRWEN